MRTTQDDSMRAKVMKLRGSNPGALRVLMDLASRSPSVVVGLDLIELYESDIWIAYKDVCGQDLAGLERAVLCSLMKKDKCDLAAAVAENREPGTTFVATEKVRAFLASPRE